MLTTAQKLHTYLVVVVQPVTAARYCLIVPACDTLTRITPHSGPHPCLFVLWVPSSGGLSFIFWWSSLDETGPVPSSGTRPLRVLSALTYACGLPDGGGGTGAPCPPSSPRRSCILACIASNFACWSGVNTARILACSPWCSVIICARRSPGASDAFDRIVSICACDSVKICRTWAVWLSFKFSRRCICSTRRSGSMPC